MKILNRKPNPLNITGDMHQINFSIDDFKRSQEENYLYVDKTKMIEDILSYDKGMALLFTRPRRFGKSMNLSMLRYFFDMTEDTMELFEGLYIEKSEFFQTHLNRYPVLYLNFKGIGNGSLEDIHESIGYIFEELLEDLYEKYSFEELKDITVKFKSGKVRPSAMKEITKVLCNHSGRKAIVLVDEYDSLLNRTYGREYWQDVARIIKEIFGELLKSNEYLEMGVLTGVSRIGKELGFSDMNNLAVYGLTKERYYEYFGFTELEVNELLKRNGVEMTQDFYRMYNGYCYEESPYMFNTVSILKFLNEYHDSGKVNLSPYWLNSATNVILKDNIASQDSFFKNQLLALLDGDTLVESIFESIDYELLDKPEYLFSLLIDTGYLCPVRKMGGDSYEIKIPNEEVKYGYRDMINLIVGADGKVLRNLCNYLTEERMEQFEKQWNQVLLQVSSFHDFSERENSYHNLMLGALLFLLGRFSIKSNREAGHGRHDIALIPMERFKQKYSPTIIEFKTAKESKSERECSDEELLALAEDALKQIEDQKYYAEYTDSYQKEDFLLIGIGMQGKRCRVKRNEG